ncbi:hypothetical protein AHF37_09174 [Paragonimus kellicotti]|nr:hypothetical protein AHF37_09174 [Paragonimus kellicotti]
MEAFVSFMYNIEVTTKSMHKQTHLSPPQMIFLKYDVDQSGFFKANEFREALKAAGYNVSNKLFNALVHRYEDPDTELMRFEDFMLCCVRLKNVFETVAAQPKTQEGAPMFNAEDTYPSVEAITVINTINTSTRRIGPGSFCVHCFDMIFLKYDVDQSGFFKANEFREALKAAGYNVSNKLFNALVHRYEDPDTELMRFEDFMLCCVRLKNVFETVAAQPKTQEGAPMFNAEDVSVSHIVQYMS